MLKTPSATPRKRGRPRKRRISEQQSPDSPKPSESTTTQKPAGSETVLPLAGISSEGNLIQSNEQVFSDSDSVTNFDVELFKHCQLQSRRDSSSRGDDNLTVSPSGVSIGAKHPPKVRLGEYMIQALNVSWHSSDFPDYDTIFICEHCMKHTISKTIFDIHQELKCRKWHPPGDEIYRKDGISVFEVDGDKEKPYCIGICLLSKFFLSDKVLCWEVEQFLFYVLTEYDPNTGLHFVGYFSKPKAEGELNLSCVMVLPPFQRKGYGRFLIELSYALSRREGTWGTPDKPLSSFGKRAYASYWKSALLEYFWNRKGALASVSIDEIRTETGIKAEDILETLVKIGFLRRQPHRAKDSSDALTHKFYLKVDPKLIQEHHRKIQSKRIVDEGALKVEVDLHRKYSAIFRTPEEAAEKELITFLQMNPSEGIIIGLENQDSSENSSIREATSMQQSDAEPEEPSRMSKDVELPEQQDSKRCETKVEVFVEVEMLDLLIQPMQPMQKPVFIDAEAKYLNLTPPECPKGEESLPEEFSQPEEDSASMQTPMQVAPPSDAAWNGCTCLVLYDPDFASRRILAPLA